MEAPDYKGHKIMNRFTYLLSCMVLLSGCSSMLGHKQYDVRVVTKADLEHYTHSKNTAPTVKLVRLDHERPGVDAFTPTSDVAELDGGIIHVLGHETLSTTQSIVPSDSADQTQDAPMAVAAVVSPEESFQAAKPEGDPAVWRKYCNGDALTPEEVDMVMATRLPEALKGEFNAQNCDGYK